MFRLTDNKVLSRLFRLTDNMVLSRHARPRWDPCIDDWATHVTKQLGESVNEMDFDIADGSASCCLWK